MIWVDSIINSMNMNLSKLLKIVKDRGALYTVVDGVTERHDLVTEQQYTDLRMNI